MGLAYRLLMIILPTIIIHILMAITVRVMI